MHTLFARKRPPLDDARAPRGAFDVALYHDEECTRLAFWRAWHCSDRPDKRTRWVMFNCCRYRVQWLADFTAADFPRLIAKTRRAEYWEIRPGIYNTAPDPKAGGYYNCAALMKLKGDHVFADYGRESTAA